MSLWQNIWRDIENAGRQQGQSGTIPCNADGTSLRSVAGRKGLFQTLEYGLNIELENLPDCCRIGA